MRPLGTVATAMLLAASAVGFVGPAATDRAITKEDVAINGTYRVTSIGNWAKINDQYNGQPTTVQTWTLSSTCTTFQNCDGTLKSDEGWSARLYMLDGIKINDQYNGQPTTVQTWTLSSTCTTFQNCDGTLKSDEGWSARLYMLDGI